MKILRFIIALLIILPTISWAQESAEDRLNDVVKLQDKAKEIKSLKKAWSAYKLGDYESALGLWMPLAETGNASAQVFIGLMYNQGHAVDQNKSEAAKWYALASEQGHVPAKWRLAMLYYHGSGFTQDYQKAAHLYHSAARQGDAYSQKALGIMYSEGLGVLKDNILAYAWFHIAYENGFKLAQKLETQMTIEMSVEEITIARDIAKECIRSSYKKCGWTLSSEDAS